MLQLTPQMRIYLAVQPVDFRCGIDGLARICRQTLDADPFSGVLFVFRNRRGTALKILIYDGQGFWLCMKRFSKGKLNWWPAHTDTVCHLTVSKLHILLWNGNPESVVIPADFRQVA
ncbi:MAG: IS66 family insertion sequence hypothetical protein [Gammaproteobacteria bacterium]|nr:MAG: IS66 family insertion sequence hypothetical protein [Gammaproteobacteria bacterium]